MTGAELRQWQHRLGLRTDRVAADMVGLSLSSWRRKCKGLSPISPMLQIVTACLEIIHTPLVRAIEGYADAHERLSLLIPIITPPAIAEQVIERLTKVGVLPTNGGK